MYYTYMLRCEDNSIYTGITVNLERRMEEHFTKHKKCARYTLTHPAKKLEAAWKSEDRALAAKLEYHIKKLSKGQKEQLIAKNDFAALAGKLDREKYQRVSDQIIDME